MKIINSQIIEFAAINKRCRYLSCTIVGNWTIEGMQIILDLIKVEALKTEMTHILLNMNHVTLPSSEFIRYKTGVYASTLFSGTYKIAIYTVASNITRFGENVAVNRFLDLSVFDNESDAIGWLTGMK